MSLNYSRVVYAFKWIVSNANYLVCCTKKSKKVVQSYPNLRQNQFYKLGHLLPKLTPLCTDRVGIQRTRAPSVHKGGGHAIMSPLLCTLMISYAKFRGVTPFLFVCLCVLLLLWYTRNFVNCSIADASTVICKKLLCPETALRALLPLKPKLTWAQIRNKAATVNFICYPPILLIFI